MDRMWLTDRDRLETAARGAAAGSIAGLLLSALEMGAALTTGEGALWPWRMASSIILGRGALTTSAGVVMVAGVIVHLAMMVAIGVAAAALYEWSAWSRAHRIGSAWAGVMGAAFGGLVWLVNFPVIAGAFFPWMWRVDQATQLLFHVAYGSTLGLALHLLGRYADNPPDAARPA